MNKTRESIYSTIKTQKYTSNLLLVVHKGSGVMEMQHQNCWDRDIRDELYLVTVVNFQIPYDNILSVFLVLRLDGYSGQTATCHFCMRQYGSEDNVKFPLKVTVIGNPSHSKSVYLLFYLILWYCACSQGLHHEPFSQLYFCEGFS